MTEQTQRPSPAHPRIVPWETPLWMAALALLTACGFMAALFKATEDTGLAAKDIPLVLTDTIFLVGLVASVELVRATRRRLWRRPKPPAAGPIRYFEPKEGSARTQALTAAIAVVLAIGAFQIQVSDAKAGTLDLAYATAHGVAMMVACIVWLRFIPDPEPRGTGFYSLYCIAFLSTAALYAILIPFHPALVPRSLASLDALGGFLQALFTGHASHAVAALEAASTV